MPENKFFIFGRVCFFEVTGEDSTVLTAALCTNWVTTLCISTIHLGDFGSFVTIQLRDCSLTWSGSAFGWRAAASCVAVTTASEKVTFQVLWEW